MFAIFPKQLPIEIHLDQVPTDFSASKKYGPIRSCDTVTKKKGATLPSRVVFFNETLFDVLVVGSYPTLSVCVSFQTLFFRKTLQIQKFPDSHQVRLKNATKKKNRPKLTVFKSYATTNRKVSEFVGFKRS